MHITLILVFEITTFIFARNSVSSIGFAVDN